MSSLQPTTHSDPVYRNSRRESRLILVTWGVFAGWVVGCSTWAGYKTDAESIDMVMGIPSWVFWGVAVPWVAANLFTIWFALWYVKEDPLEPAGHTAEAGNIEETGPPQRSEST